MKLHLRIAELPGVTYRVLTLRPSSGVRYSNNRFHDTWHILTSPAGAAVLARLLWGLALQERPGTVLLIDRPHLVPTPFEADPAVPCLFARDGLSSAARDHLSALRRWLRRPRPPTGTVVWKTYGMEEPARPRITAPMWSRERMDRREGLLCYTAPAEILRHQARSIDRVARNLHGGTSHTYLAEGDHWQQGVEGEVQVLADFDARVTAAREVRARTVARPAERIVTDEEREATWDRVEALRAARRAVAHGAGLRGQAAGREGQRRPL